MKVYCSLRTTVGREAIELIYLGYKKEGMPCLGSKAACKLSH